MKITEGLFSNMVLQRNRRNECEAFFKGEADASGVVRATVCRGAKPVRGYADIEIGRSTVNKVKGHLRGLPAGGPYTVSLVVVNNNGKVVDKVVVKNILVGDLWILAGQSNMEGIGSLKDAPRPHSMVRSFSMDDIWDVACEPVHVLADAVDPVHCEIRGGSVERLAAHLGTGPGMAFGQEMHRISGIPQGIIPCAHGGSSMSQWSPELRDHGGHSLYGATIRRVRVCGGAVAGIVWYQGCSDADEPQSRVYTERMKKLVASFRRDCGERELPFVAVQISRYVGIRTGSFWWNSIREQQRLLPKVIPSLLTVPVIDLSLDDCIHISGKDCIVVGKRCAQAMAVLRYKARHIKPPITLKSVSVEKNRFSGAADIVVAFDNAVGGLKSAGRPSGFELSENIDRIPEDAVFRIDLCGNTAILRTGLSVFEAGSLWLFYGFGTNPYCNITDHAGRSIPMFGPLRAGRAHALTPFITTLRVSPLLPSTGKHKELKYPLDKAALFLATRTFPDKFCSCRPEIVAAASADNLIYYAFDFSCSEAMSLVLHLGYDGPIKVWIDGVERFSDPDGTNPALPFDDAVSFSAAAGVHEVLLALGTNRGGAWGVFLRMTREDVTAQALKSGSFVLPRITG